MKFSHGLKNLLSPLMNLIELPKCLGEAMAKSGKRGQNATLYPTDLRKTRVFLDCVHDVSGKVLSVLVIDGNMKEAIEHLQDLVREEDYFCDSWQLAA
jgi:hypothetical protein